MTESNSFKRVTCKRRHPNQLIQELLESLYRDAVENRSNIVQSLKEAISSIEKYPLQLSSGAECAILKGFDQRLCRYIDSRINGLSNKNKKTKVCAKDSSDERIEQLRLSPGLEEICVSEMTSKKSRRKNRNLETNTEKCQFQSMFGELSHNRTDKHRSSARNNHESNQLERNNNTGIQINYSEPILDTQFVNRSRIDSDDNTQNKEKSQDKPSNNKFASFETWETFTNYNIQSTSNTRPVIETLNQPIVVLDQSEDENSDTEIKTSDDVSIRQPKHCLHNEEAVQCEQCESFSTAADAFQLYFKEKSKRDAEEIGKIGKCANKLYKPAYRSGQYAIVVALLEQRNECPYRDCLTKDELIQKAQIHTDHSFTNPKPESNYTAWTFAKRLISKGMIQKTNIDGKNEDFYTLTAKGRAVAMELVKGNTPTVTVNDVIFHQQRNDRVPSLEDVVLVPPPPSASIDEEQSSVFIEMPPGTFDIVLLIDKREQFELTLPQCYCRYEARSLTIGDFLWVARSKKTGQELVLPYIVERKRMDDLASSIKDGRFHEQKFRLRKCGLKNVLYLVESNKKNGEYTLPMATLMQAVVNTSVLEEFNIVKTDSLDNTFKFLDMLSQRLIHDFLPVFLRGCNKDTQGKELMTFEFFNKFSCKNKPLTVRDTFIKMLLQLKGLSIEKALAITHKYSTPRLLMKAYERCTIKEGELLLANLKFNNFTRNVGPAVSKTVYKLFSNEM